jgi:uncharacterized protein
LRLAVKGNPTALLPLYAPASGLIVLTPLGEELRQLAPRVLSQHAVRRFLGYMDSRRRRPTGETPRHGTPNRPEPVERYGYDVKYASHALRLVHQGLDDRADRASRPVPRPGTEREEVLAVKPGEVREMGKFLERIAHLQSQVQKVLDTGAAPLPPGPDREAIDRWCVAAHHRHRGWDREAK